ncbi:hypothetical protein ACQY0O_003271 [Thecaphora frezii]|nr:putative major facilitator superfamily [Thecaphora frezii]
MSNQSASPARDVESLEEKKSISDATPITHLDASGKNHGAVSSASQTNVTFDPEAEKRLRRKIDLYILPTVALCYLWCFIDRSNIGNARLAGLEKDLGMNPKSYQYNILLTVFYVSYAAFEIPSTILTKVLGPGRWIPAMTFSFGLLSMCTAFVKTYHQALAVRFLLGIFEAGMLPSIAFYLARWYRKDELALRCAMYLVMSPSAGAFGGLLASGILTIDRIGSVQRWEMIFLIEGIISTAVGIIAFFTLTDNVQAARWLTPEEKELAIGRVQSELVGQAVVIDKARTRSVIRGITSPTSLACATMFFFNNITVQGIAFFLPSVVRTLYPNKTVVQQQLLTVPPNVAGAFAVVGMAYASTKFRRRGYFVAASAGLMVTSYAMYLGSTNLNVRYAASFFGCVGAFTHGPLLPSWASINTNNDSERAGAIGVVVLFGNLGGLVATWTFLSKYAPNQVPGNSLNLAGAVIIILLSLSLVAWQRRRNAMARSGKRDHLLLNKTPEEIEAMGSSHPHFQFRY